MLAGLGALCPVILRDRNSSQMVGAHTERIPADMINNQVRGDGTIGNLISYTMSTDTARPTITIAPLFVDSEHAINRACGHAAHGPCPGPAGIARRFGHMAPEESDSLIIVHGAMIRVMGLLVKC